MGIIIIYAICFIAAIIIIGLAEIDEIIELIKELQKLRIANKIDKIVAQNINDIK